MEFNSVLGLNDPISVSIFPAKLRTGLTPLMVVFGHFARCSRWHGAFDSLGDRRGKYGKKEGCLRWVSASRPSKLLKGRTARWTRTILFLTFAEDKATRYHASQC